MNGLARGAAIALVLLAGCIQAVEAQDTTVAVVRHVLPIDVSRVQPFRRAYEMTVYSGDSATTVGHRELQLMPATYAGNPAWLLVETRTGLVPAAESLFVSSDLRPLHWYSDLGRARLGVEFVGDTVFGAVSSPASKQSLVLPIRPDLLVSQAMVEMFLALLPLTPQWTDSAGVLSVDMGGGTVISAELSVIGEEELLVDSAVTRPSWVVALRADRRNVLFWVDKESGEVHRVQQPLPLHIGSLLEYRRRRDAAPVSATPPIPPALRL